MQKPKLAPLDLQVPEKITPQELPVPITYASHSCHITCICPRFNLRKKTVMINYLDVAKETFRIYLRKFCK